MYSLIRIFVALALFLTASTFIFFYSNSITTYHGHNPIALLRVPTVLEASKKFAYALYITNDEYACAALVLSQSILDTKKNPAIDIIAIHTPEVSQNYRDRLSKLGIILQETETTEVTVPGAADIWIHSNTKLDVFKLTQYDRIIFIDSDGLVMKNMDHLFHLPSYFLYASRAYWLHQPFLTSVMLIIEPNQKIYDFLHSELHERESRGEINFDMDIINALYIDTVSLLPGYFVVLNSEFVKSPNEPAMNTPFKTVDDLTKEAYIVHFSTSQSGVYGKPWRGERKIKKQKNAHPFFYEIFNTWWNYQDRLCY